MTPRFPGALSWVLEAAGHLGAQGLLLLGTGQLNVAEKKQVLKDKKANGHQVSSLLSKLQDLLSLYHMAL